ncbi:protein FAM171B-like [Syngnathoides biaculeatus]|uniref:protein FAM171B-like n=1 Tax=Syngnathoides biaculeatus TaxID=300417 RepID=UPI002ADE91E4|nr:protein FAM171B-like [Syngnathoides biaculeatus]
MLMSFLLSALILCEREALGQLSATGNGTSRSPSPSPSPPPMHGDAGGSFTFSTHREIPRRQQQIPQRLSGSNFNLKVQVTDMLTRQYLSQAEVDLYVNYTRTNTVLTGEEGSVFLQVPFQTGSPVTVVACKDSYVCTLLPYRTIRTPIFSSVTIPLRRLTQGSIWLFEDSVLITDQTSDASLQPVVQFPKSLLNVTEGSDIASFKAYVTTPKPILRERDFVKTLAIMSRTTGYISMDLNPVAAVSVRLFSGETELHISGPIKISLTLPDNCGLQSSNAVPAWLYNRTTGGWMRQGLGTVVSEGTKLSWTFTAPHLGYWIAAPMPTIEDVFTPVVLSDLFDNYSPYLMVILGGMLCIFACLLAGLLYCHRNSSRQTKVTQMLPLTTKDESTTTGSNEDIERSSPFAGNMDGHHNVSVSIYNGNIIPNPNALASSAEANDVIPSSNTTDLIRIPAPLTDSLVFYNQPVAFLHASAFFQVEDQQEQPHWSKSMASYTGGPAKLSEESCSQNVSQSSSATEKQEGDTEKQVDNLENAHLPTTRGHYSLLESASVPETLSKMRTSRHSMDAATELSKRPSSQPPRAWFVSLEGKPAAEIHYAVAEQQRRRRATESQETSLDSGVDMIEMNQTHGRRAVTLERNTTFVKRTSSNKDTSR